MAGRKKFDKLEINENYYAATGEKSPEPEKKKTVKKIEKVKSDEGEKKSFSLSEFFKKSPEPINPPTKFTYSKIRKTGFLGKKKPAVEVKAPSKAIFFLMAGVLILMFLSRHIVSEKMLSKFSQGEAAVVDVIVNVAVFLIPTLIYMLSSPERKTKYYAKGFSAATIPFAATMLLFIICFTALQKYYITYNYMYSVEMGTASKNVFLVLLTGAVLPAVFEQFFVHGVFQHEISKYAGGFCGVCVSAFVFAILQFDLQYFLVYLFIGIVMGCVTHVSGSVFPTMIIRFVSCSVSIFLWDRFSFVAQERIGGTLLMIILAVFSFVFLIAALRIAERISNKRSVEYLKRAKAEDGAETEEQAEKEKGKAKKHLSHDDDMFFVAKEGNTLVRFGKVVLTPYMLVAVAVFVIELIVK